MAASHTRVMGLGGLDLGASCVRTHLVKCGKAVLIGMAEDKLLADMHIVQVRRD